MALSNRQGIRQGIRKPLQDSVQQPANRSNRFVISRQDASQVLCLIDLLPDTNKLSSKRMMSHKLIFACFLLALGACSSYGSPTRTSPPDPSTQTLSPPSIEELSIESHGSRMAGLAYLAAGAGPHPTVILLHGYPGNEKNLDIAQALRRAGWNAVFFHYRGAWGSEGEFSIRSAEQDVAAVFNYLTQPMIRKRLKVDNDNISLVGHSMGGHMAIAGLLDLADVRCAISYDGANMGAGGGQGLFNDPRLGKVWRDYSDSLFMLKGWSGDRAVKELTEFGAELDLVPRAVAVAGRPVLMISADTKVIPESTHILPVYKALKATPNSNVEYLLIKDDHSFSASRPELIAATQSFLERRCR
jgi:pimeloyl-ACP methyl ester carboxylesterase